MWRVSSLALTGLFRCTQPWPAISRKVSVDITGQDHRGDACQRQLVRSDL
jgi:hypothetical protein